MKIILLAALLWGAFFTSVSASSFSGSVTIGKLIDNGSEVNVANLKAHTVIVTERETVNGELQYHTGAGLVVDARHILTVNHAVTEVIYGADVFYVPSQSSPAYYATVERQDASHDLALLTIDKNAPDMIAIPMKFAATQTLNEDIFTIGHPLNDYYNLSTGILSGFHSKGGVGHGDSTLLSLVAHPGNSGGMVIDSSGDLVGMIFSQNLQAGNLCYMTSAEDIQAFLKEG